MKPLAFIIILFCIIIAGCAQQEAIPGEQQIGNVQQRAGEIKEQFKKMYEGTSDNMLLPPDANKEFQLIEEFKQYALDENGDRQYSCNVPKDIPPIVDGKIHTVWSAVSNDGTIWKEEQYIIRGSVPEVIYFQNKYYMFVMGKCLMYVSDDGLHFEAINYTLKADNLPEDFKDFGVDPTAVMVNNEIHLFFYEPTQTSQPVDVASITGDHKIIQYTSDDAITWERVGEAIAVPGITDPDIIYYDAKWYLFMSAGQSAKGAVSDDGISFSLLNNGNPVEEQGGVSDTILVNDLMHMYAHRNENGKTVIKLLTSRDGSTWQDKGTVLENGEAPSVVQLPDGTYRMYYVKRLSEEEYAKLTDEKS